jgi:hypothetical protein
MSRTSVRWMSLGLMLLSASTAADSQGRRAIAVFFDNPALELSAQSHRDSTAFPFGEFPVARVIRSARPERQAILELLRGPTRAEADSGYTTNLDRLRLSKFSLSRGQARVWLRGKLLLKGTLSASRLRQQVERTLKQFRTVRSVTLTINGRKDFESLK